MPRPVATISQGGFVLIPPSNLGIFAMKVTRSNAIVDDITERFTDTAAITLGVSEIIGNFEVKVDNSDDIYTNNWVIGDKFEVFLSALDEDEKKVVKAIREQDGITQATLRIRIGLSKTKLSFILSDLEKKGLLTKVVKGRTNQVFLKKNI